MRTIVLAVKKSYWLQVRFKLYVPLFNRQ